MKNIFLTVLPFLFLFVLLFQIDQSLLEDLGRHLKMGEAIVSCHCVPETNLFSYTNPNFPVINHEWLTQLILYLVYKSFGLQSLLVLKMLILTTAFAIVYFLARSAQKSSSFWLTVVSLFCVLIFSSRFRVRPEMFSYLFIALFLLILNAYQRHCERSETISYKEKPFENDKERNIYKRLLRMLRPLAMTKWVLLLLPVIELLWVNMHIYFIFGIVIYGTFLIEKFVVTKKVDKRLLLIGILIVFATLVNPQFIKGALLPLTFQTNYGLSVEENMSIFDVGKYFPSFIYTLSLQIILFEMLVAIFSITLPILFRKTSIAKNLNAACTGLLGLRYVRSLSLFGIFGLQPLSEKLTSIEEALLKKTDKYFLNTIKAIIFALTLLASFMYAKGLYDNKVLQFRYQPYAEGAVDFINTHHLNGPIFNNYHIGNYLIYGLYPREKIFIDARPEMYPASFLKDYERMYVDQDYFNQQVARYNINLIVMGVQLEDPLTIRPFMLRQIRSKEWIPLYADGNVTILIKNVEKNQQIITKLHLAI